MGQTIIILRRSDGFTDVALFRFLTQQKWAAAYEKKQEGQNAIVIQNTQGVPNLTLPAPPAMNDDVHDISAGLTALQDPMNPIDGAVENLEKLYDVAKMIAPTVVFFDEGDALAPRRSASGGSPADKLTNTFLNLIDGEIPLNRVFTVLTTNRLDILDPALIRSKRLKVMEISGDLRKKDIAEIIEGLIAGIPL